MSVRSGKSTPDVATDAQSGPREGTPGPAPDGGVPVGTVSLTPLSVPNSARSGSRGPKVVPKQSRWVSSQLEEAKPGGDSFAMEEEEVHSRHLSQYKLDCGTRTYKHLSLEGVRPCCAVDCPACAVRLWGGGGLWGVGCASPCRRPANPQPAQAQAEMDKVHPRQLVLGADGTETYVKHPVVRSYTGRHLVCGTSSPSDFSKYGLGVDLYFKFMVCPRTHPAHTPHTPRLHDLACPRACALPWLPCRKPWPS